MSRCECQKQIYRCFTSRHQRSFNFA